MVSDNLHVARASSLEKPIPPRVRGMQPCHPRRGPCLYGAPPKNLLNLLDLLTPAFALVFILEMSFALIFAPIIGGIHLFHSLAHSLL